MDNTFPKLSIRKSVKKTRYNKNKIQKKIEDPTEGIALRYSRRATSSNHRRTNRKPPKVPLNTGDKLYRKVIIIGNTLFYIDQLLDLEPKNYQKRLINAIQTPTDLEKVEAFLKAYTLNTIEPNNEPNNTANSSVNTGQNTSVTIEGDRVKIGKRFFTKKQIQTNPESVLNLVSSPEDQIAIILFAELES